MRKSRKTLMITSILIMAVIWAFIILEKGTDLLKGLDLFIFILIILIGIIAFVIALKNDREEKEGLPADDELSNLIKYKSGYYAYLISMYMWLFIFIMKDKFPDIETMLGGGILLSALISFIVKFVIKKNFNA
jgi:hypothetical protein